MQSVVIKIGGASLFSDDVGLEAIRRTVRPIESETRFVLIGGGDTIESMRTLHALYPTLDPVAIHWRCIRLLDSTWEVACELLPECCPISEVEELDQSISSHSADSYLVRPSAYYAEALLPDIPATWQPKMSWETTTDALAWLLAKRVGASFLRIAKRIDCDLTTSLQQAAQSGIIDTELARLVEADPDREQLLIETFKL